MINHPPTLQLSPPQNPILSIPSGMRFVLMCQVLDGEPPIQIKWFKDNLDLAALLTQQAGDDHHHQPTDFSPAALKLIGLTSAVNGDATNSSAGKQQHLEHIEMISNDELGSSLLFRKVRQQHSGNYTCLASNRFGSTSYTSLMTVKGECPAFSVRLGQIHRRLIIQLARCRSC
jgi:hypothetical protein